MAQRCIQIAVVYLVVGAVLGFIMGISTNFSLAPVHAHLLLAGWLSLAMAGVIYRLYPAAAQTLLARAHFWLHNAGLPIFMVALGLALTGNEQVVPVIATGASLLLLGLVLFAVNVLRCVRA
jgi:cbb3-type cytochrome oxidase subunit 1